MYGANKIISSEKSALVDVQSDSYTGVDPLMTNGDRMSILTIKRAYLKMTERDELIGWEELTDELANTLAQIMGDDKFVEWNNKERG